MTTLEQHSVQIDPSHEAKVRVTVESADVESKSQQDTPTNLKQILSSLADARKYIPTQVYAFLDTMEGKTIDDLRLEAMQLAAKAQEEAKKRAGDVTNYGKAIIDTANQRVQDVADVARDKTNDIVQPPLQSLQATKEKSKSLAQKGLETGTSLAFQSLERTAGMAYQGANLFHQRFMPIIAPVTDRAVEYLPAPAKTFYTSNVAGKTLDEITDKAIEATRRNLLTVQDKDVSSAKNKDKEVKPNLRQITLELKDAAMSGALLRNALRLTEKAVDSAFGPAEVPTDASLLHRTYLLSTRVTGGVRSYADNQISAALQQVRKMADNRVNGARGMLTQGSGQLQQSVMPILQRIGELPVIPDFVIKYLRNMKPEESSASSTQQQTSKVPATSVRVDIIGATPSDAPQATTTSKSTTTKTSGSTGSSGPIGNTNAEGLGLAGEAGQGVTTTGAEENPDKVNWPAGMTGPPELQQTTTSEQGSGKHGKHHKKHGNKL